MDMTIDQQMALDEALVPHARRLRIGKSNFHLRSDITSKESTLQLVYDVLRLTPFYKAFLITADVPEIYMQEFWATAIVHHHSIRQTFDELPFEKGILAFLRFFGHGGEIRKLIDVNINKLHQPWRSFAAFINNCLSGKSTGYDSLRNSEAYKEYYAVASGAAPPKTKESVRKTKNTMTEAEQIKLATKRSLQQTHISQASGLAADEETGIIPGVPDVTIEESNEEI
nr:hypothetical protein [Tanacetum cinerariifolium]